MEYGDHPYPFYYLNVTFALWHPFPTEEFILFSFCLNFLSKHFWAPLLSHIDGTHSRTPSLKSKPLTHQHKRKEVVSTNQVLTNNREKSVLSKSVTRKTLRLNYSLIHLLFDSFLASPSAWRWWGQVLMLLPHYGSFWCSLAGNYWPYYRFGSVIETCFTFIWFKSLCTKVSSKWQM